MVILRNKCTVFVCIHQQDQVYSAELTNSLELLKEPLNHGINISMRISGCDVPTGVPFIDNLNPLSIDR